LKNLKDLLVNEEFEEFEGFEGFEEF